MLKRINEKVFEWLRKSAKPNHFQRPSKLTLIALVCVWAIGSALLLTTMTNGFTTPAFSANETIPFFLLLGSTSSVISVLINYFRYKAK